MANTIAEWFAAVACFRKGPVCACYEVILTIAVVFTVVTSYMLGVVRIFPDFAFFWCDDDAGQ